MFLLQEEAMNNEPKEKNPFDPVPSATKRHDGWTPERQRLFIRALGMIGIVSAAAAAVGMSRKSAYELLKRAGPESGFARAWREAQAAGRTNAFFTGVDRAFHGVEVPYFYGGLQRGTKRVYNDRLLIAALRAIDRFQGGDGSFGT
jgi:hypothetical protein